VSNGNKANIEPQANLILGTIVSHITNQYPIT